MTASDPNCKRFDGLLANYLAGESSAAERADVESHSRVCSRCHAELSATAMADRLLARWHAPEPPAGLTRRILASVSRPAAGSCDDARPRLAALADGDLPSAEADRVRQHADQCGSCHDELDRIRALNRHLASWTVPEPPVGLTDRILGELTGSRSRLGRVRSSTWAAAAALALLAGWGALRDEPAGPNGTTPRIPAAQFDMAQNALYRGMPDFMGTFEVRPASFASPRRPTGNEFHRALREVMTSNGNGR